MKKSTARQFEDFIDKVSSDSRAISVLLDDLQNDQIESETAIYRIHALTVIADRITDFSSETLKWLYEQTWEEA